MHEAVLDGVDLRGYTPVERYDDGTGDFARRRKESFYWYKKVIETNGEDLK